MRSGFFPLQPGASFVNAVRATSGSSTFTSTLTSLGAVAGDLLCVMFWSEQGGGLPVRGSGGGWTSVGNCAVGTGGSEPMYTAIAVAGDLGSTITFPSTRNGAFLVIYRGARSLVIVAGPPGSAVNSLTGITKSSSHVGLVGIDQTDVNGVGALSAPTTWTQRASDLIQPSGARAKIYDRLYPSNLVYNDRTTFTMTALVIACILELRS